MNKSLYRPDIDGLRAVAVVLVVFYHYGFSTFSGGYVGVDVFFVISGFLITRLIVNQLADNRFSFTQFYIRRIRRLFPALLVVLIATLFTGFFLFSPEDLTNLGKSSLFAILSTSNFVFWQEAGYFDTGAELKPLLHTWSLSVEEQFYFVWPLLLFLLYKLNRRYLIVGFLVAAVAASLWLSERVLDTDPHAVFYLLPFRVAELAIGALCVWILAVRTDNRLLLESMVLIGLTAILYAAVSFTEETRFPGLAALIPCLGTALIIIGGEAKYSGALLRSKLFVGTGLISYSLYLVHWPIFVFYQHWIAQPLGVQSRYTLILVSTISAIALYFLVERRFRFPKPKQLQQPPPRFFLKTAALVALFCLPAAATWIQNGWPFRVPEEIRSLVDDVNDKRKERFDIYSSQCTEANALCRAFDNSRQNVVVLGDSHGIDGFNAVSVAHPEMNLVYAARGACPPFVDVAYFVEAHPNTEGCLEHNQQIFSQWTALKDADYIVFSALFDSESIPRLDQTIANLQKLTAAKIVVLGTGMTFKSAVPALIVNSGRVGGLDNYIMGFSDRSKFQIDKEFESHYKNSDVTYISKLDLLCPDGTCQIIVNDEFDLLTYDRHHLGMAAATIVAAELKNRRLFE